MQHLDHKSFSNPITSRAVLIIALSALFLFYKYIIQNFPSIMAPQLMSAFHLQGLGLGMLSGAYFWTYLIVPLFVGIILDTYGAKWPTSGAIFVCAIGLWVFARAESLNMAIWGRALTGIGVSFATISYLKLASVWFPKQYYALLTSLLVSSGMLGAICGQMPLAWLTEHVGWRQSLMDLSWVGLALTVFFLLVVKDKANLEAHPPESTKDLWLQTKAILRNKQNWLLTAYSGLAFAPVVIFCGLWGNPFLQKAYGLDKIAASSLISLVFVGLGIASPLFAILIRQRESRIPWMVYSTLVSALSLIVVIYGQGFSKELLGGLLFIFGFSLGAFPFVFVIGKECNPLFMAGTVTSFINASDAFLDALAEPAIGVILDMFGKTPGTATFSLLGYHIALGLLPAFQIIGALLLRQVSTQPGDGHDKLI